MARRVLLVANPRAGSRSALALARAVVPRLAMAGCSVEVRPTERRGHALEIARAATGFDAVVAVGGDGTLHEVVAGLMELPGHERPRAGLIPAGSGNSLAFDLGISNPDEGVRRVAAGSVRSIDLARAQVDGSRIWSVNVLGWGAVARINARAERLRWAARQRYTLAALAELMRPRLPHGGARVDGQPAEDWLFGTASISAVIGRGMRIAPRARVDDGQLDLVRVRRGSRLALARVLEGVFRGTHVDSSLVDYRQVKGFELALEPGSQLLVDGDLMPAREVSVAVEPAALALLA